MSAKMKNAGFTLVELVVVVLILGILAGVAAPKLFNASSDAAVQAVAEDFQAFALSVEIYYHDVGEWPSNLAAGQMPPELAGAFTTDFFAEATPVGGRYDWGKGPLGPRISIAAASPDRDVWREIDAVLDDGNLLTGAMKLDESGALTRLRWFFTK